ncbi:MAG: GNAT family N-acetyltransferase [Leptolyngbyaceae cyanobacterium SM1_1_3]|nr:GNAT family N-acetyltransferase [Leptolyngbyaceae cyanobacterium SM1_1_3]NJN02538.1 GNAT family N-acetyltransferase [Leptolyngbyaceae cyanobacterium RM1_1_2]NJO08558.1 GNAT family N-acetyltransferase [Leptolyngbyaceae cyanobacterium SL_1_1]
MDTGFKLETARLTIRDWEPETDADQASKIYGDSAVTQWLSDRHPAKTPAEVRDRLQHYCDRFYTHNNGTGVWAVVEKATGQAIGSILLVQLPDSQGDLTQNFEIGWHFCPASWGQGFATEAARAIVNYGFEQLGLDILYAVTLPDNHPSIKVMQRLGMTPLGITQHYHGGTALELFKLERSPQH